LWKKRFEHEIVRQHRADGSIPTAVLLRLIDGEKMLMVHCLDLKSIFCRFVWPWGALGKDAMTRRLHASATYDPLRMDVYAFGNAQSLNQLERFSSQCEATGVTLSTKTQLA
jgi:hypothetical protein